MRIFKALDLVPDGIELLFAVGAHCLNRGGFVDALTLFKDRHMQPDCAEVCQRLALIGKLRIEDDIGLCIVDDLICQRDDIGDCHAGFLIKETPRRFEAGVRDLDGVLRKLDARCQDIGCLFGACRCKLVDTAEDRLRARCDQPLADAEAVDLCALHEQVTDHIRRANWMPRS